ncbi:MAG: HlyD family efflux transporter periplasmic adaptor subunit [Lentimonas sp.]
MTNQFKEWLRSLSVKQRVLYIVGMVLGLWILFGLTRCGNSSGSEDGEQLDRYHEVERGDFNITVLSKGELDAIENYELRFEGVGKKGLRIEQIVKDKSKVTKGDVVASFADEEYVEEITLLEESIQDTQADYEERLTFETDLFENNIRDLREALDDAELNISLFLGNQSVERDKSITTLAQASNKYETAKEALNKYQNLQYRTESKQKQAEIDQKEQEYYDAVDDLDKATQELSEARLKDDSTREKAERAVTLAEKKVNNLFAAWETARKADRQFRRYDHPQTLRRLTIAAEISELDLKRLLIKAESDKVQADRRYRRLLREKSNIVEKIEQREKKFADDLERIENDYETNMGRLNERLVEFRSDLEGLILRAPVDGIVTLGAPPRRGREPKELAVGIDVKPKEIVARIPDLSQFRVRCDIPEIYRSRIEQEQPAILKNAALPELEMKGVVESIATMSQRVYHWDSRSPRVYETNISTNSSDPRLVPGMTVEVEILVDAVKGVLFLPVEAVYNNEGESYCKVKTGFSTEERLIETGRSSYSHVEVVSGLEEGDVVLLFSASAENGGS